MKKVKVILPIVAIMFAVAGVFATGKSTPAAAPVDVTLGYLATQPNCIKDGTCTDVGSPACTTASGLILRIRVAGNPVTCQINATGIFTTCE